MRVFIAHSHHDAEIADRVAAAIDSLGYEIVRFDSLVGMGDSISNRIRESLVHVDALVLLWSGHGAESTNLLHEMGYFVGVGPARPVLTVLLDNTPVPREIAGRMHLDGRDVAPDDIGFKIAGALSRIEGEQKHSEEAAEQRKVAVEKTSETYITESLESLGKRERKYQTWSLCCYALGYATLLAGLSYALYRAFQDPPEFADVAQSIYISALTLTVIGFLAAASRFAFVLGKSFMVESLRNHDRIHAIRFGEFYLKAFGQNASWDDLKDAFQHWNLDTGSSFKDQTDDSVDPQILKLLGEVVKKVKP